MKHDERIPSVEGGEGERRRVHYRRFPHRTSDVLAALEALPLDAARSLDALVQAQHRDQLEHEQHCIPETYLGTSIDDVIGKRSVRGLVAGGGRRAETHPPAE